MKLEVVPRDDAQFGVQQIQGQLEEIHLKIQNMQKERGKEANLDIWCIRCRVSGHTKDQCPLLVDYMQAGGPNPLCLKEVVWPTSPTLWCTDCRIAGLHGTNHLPHLGAYVPELKQQWCLLCSSVGHEEHNCRTYDLMIDQ